MSFFNGLPNINTTTTNAGGLNVAGTSNITGDLNVTGTIRSMASLNASEITVSNTVSLGTNTDALIRFYGATGSTQQSLVHNASTSDIVEALAALGLVKKI